MTYNATHDKSIQYSHTRIHTFVLYSCILCFPQYCFGTCTAKDEVSICSILEQLVRTMCVRASMQ